MIYRSSVPPQIDLGNIKGDVPVAMFVGTKDDLGDVTDARWTAALLNHSGPALVHYQELEAGHTTFLVGKDMSYLN